MVCYGDSFTFFNFYFLNVDGLLVVNMLAYNDDLIAVLIKDLNTTACLSTRYFVDRHSVS
jgi:hypothetical protein